MKKLLALLCVASLLALVTGCPPATTSSTAPKKDTKTGMTKSDTGYKAETKKEENLYPTKKTGFEETKKEETKKEEFKETKKEGGKETKKEETKETKKDGGK